MKQCFLMQGQVLEGNMNAPQMAMEKLMEMRQKSKAKRMIRHLQYEKEEENLENDDVGDDHVSDKGDVMAPARDMEGSPQEERDDEEDDRTIMSLEAPLAS